MKGWWLLLFSLAAAMLSEMKPMDPYSTSCAGFISAMYAFGGSECTQLKSWNRAPCQCKIPAYVETVIGCIDADMKNVTEAIRNDTRLMAYQMFLDMTCPDENITMSNLETCHKNSSDLPAYSGGRRQRSTAPWPVTGAFQVTDEEAHNAFKAYELNNESEPRSKRLGSALIAYWGGIILLRFLSVCLSNVFVTTKLAQAQKPAARWFRKNVTMPALISKRSLNVTLSRTGIYIPTRAHSLTIFGFSVLVVVFTFAYLPVWFPNYSWTYSNTQTYSTMLGQRSGVLCLYLSPLLILFAGRNNFLQWITAWPQEIYVLYHRWIGRAVVFELIVHTIAYNVQRISAKRYQEMWRKGYWKWGIVGAAFGIFLAFQSLAFLRRRSYETFLVLHILGAVFFIVGGYYHIDLLEEPLGLNFFYAMIAVWAFDRAARLLRVVTSNPFATAKVTLCGDMLELVMDRPKSWNVQMRPGVYTFVHIMKPSLFIQSHPFTLMSSVDEPKKIKLFCRVRDGMTRRLARMALEASPCLSVRVLLDGPYGHAYDLSEFDECVFVAGGVGITAPFAYIQHMLWKYPRGFQKITVLWAIRDESPLQWFESELQFLTEYSRVNVQLYISQGTSKNSRALDVVSSVHDCIAASQGPISVMCCGPGSMNSEARHAVATGLGLTKNFVEYFEESFSF